MHPQHAHSVHTSLGLAEGQAQTSVAEVTSHHHPSQGGAPNTPVETAVQDLGYRVVVIGGLYLVVTPQAEQH